VVVDLKFYQVVVTRLKHASRIFEKMLSRIVADANLSSDFPTGLQKVPHRLMWTCDKPFVSSPQLWHSRCPTSHIGALSMPKPVVTIENWSVVQNVSSCSFQELHQGNRLTGYVEGHAHFPNTKVVYTSPIVSVDLTQRLVETLNTMYRLGEPSAEYEIWQRKGRASAAA
jgi:hypothetical protein